MPGAEETAFSIPEGKTAWDVIEEKLLQHKDIPAIEYFGRMISRPEFIDMAKNVSSASMIPSSIWMSYKGET